MKGRLRFVLFWGYVLLSTLILIEVGTRLWGYSEHLIYGPIYQPFDESVDIPFVLKANLEGTRGPGLTKLNTDSLGLRSVTSGSRYGPKEYNEVRIAVVGDSDTYGEGVRDAEQTYCQVLEVILNLRFEHLRFKVLNFGVSSYSVKEMTATLKYRMLEVDPDLVAMAIIYDDFRLSRTPEIDKWGYRHYK